MKNKILIAHKELNLRPSDSVLWCSTTKPQSIKSEDLRINSSWGLRIFFLIHPHTCDKTQGTSFTISLPSSKPYHVPYSKLHGINF